MVRGSETGSSLLNDATIPTLYTLVSGELPAGVTLDTTTGVLSGIPVAATIGDFEEITVRASNAFGDSSQIIRFSIHG